MSDLFKLLASKGVFNKFAIGAITRCKDEALKTVAKTISDNNGDFSCVHGGDLITADRLVKGYVDRDGFAEAELMNTPNGIMRWLCTNAVNAANYMGTTVALYSGATDEDIRQYTGYANDPALSDAYRYTFNLIVGNYRYLKADSSLHAAYEKLDAVIAILQLTGNRVNRATVVPRGAIAEDSIYRCVSPFSSFYSEAIQGTGGVLLQCNTPRTKYSEIIGDLFMAYPSDKNKAFFNMLDNMKHPLDVVNAVVAYYVDYFTNSPEYGEKLQIVSKYNRNAAQYLALKHFGIICNSSDINHSGVSTQSCAGTMEDDNYANDSVSTNTLNAIRHRRLSMVVATFPNAPGSAVASFMAKTNHMRLPEFVQFLETVKLLKA